MANLLGDEQNAISMVGFLIEKLGGSVTLTKDFVEQSLTSRGGTLYVEVDVVNDTVHLEVFPKGMNRGASDENQANHTRLRDGRNP